MSLKSDFPQDVVKMKFQKPTTTIAANNASMTTYEDQFTQYGLLQQTSGTVIYTSNGLVMKSTDDIFIDRTPDSLKVSKEWQIVIDDIRYGETPIIYMVAEPIVKTGPPDEPYCVQVSREGGQGKTIGKKVT